MGGLAGGAGFLGGLGNALSGGLGGIFSIGANAAAAGGGLLATLGAAVPILGAVTLAFFAFKKTTTVLDTGIMATVTNMEVLVKSFKDIETSQFFGLIKRRSTKTDKADDETTRYVRKIVNDVQDAVEAAASDLGFAADVFEGFSHAMKISMEGVEGQEAVQKRLEEGMRDLGSAYADMIPGLEELRHAGEASLDALNRLASSLVNVNLWMGNLRLNTYEVGLAGADAASAFVDLFGSLENFTSASSAYYQEFYSDAERLARATDLLKMEMQALGIDALPATRAAFRALVDEADALGNTELVAALIQLSPAFAEITNQANALNDALTGQGLYKTLAEAVFANTSEGYRQPIGEVLNASGAETASLLREVVRAEVPRRKGTRFCSERRRSDSLARPRRPNETGTPRYSHSRTEPVPRVPSPPTPPSLSLAFDCAGAQCDS